MKSTAARPPSSAPARWDHRRWGTLDDPVHKSHLSSLIGEFACTKQFQFDRVREASGEERTTIAGTTAMGTASHETIARALRSEPMRERLLGAVPPRVSGEQVRPVLLEEFSRATHGLEVVWYGSSEFAKSVNERVGQLVGLFNDLRNHVAAVELVEGGFISEVGEIWTEGHIDLVYRPRIDPAALALTDWKTGTQKPHPLVLDHGYESGFYSAALERGLFLPTDVLERWRSVLSSPAENDQVPLEEADLVALQSARSERAAMHAALRGLARRRLAGHPLPAGVVTFDRFPEVVRLTHLADYVPYQKTGKKRVDRAEEIDFWGLSAAGEVKYSAGQQRGPAWYRVRRTAEDVQRLEKLLRGVVGWVRMGKFVESVGEKCMRCAYRGPCLTSGYELGREDSKELNASLRGLDLTGVDGLSVDD